MSRLVLVRHGETVWNEEGRWGGGRVDTPLSNRGRLTAVAIGATLDDVNLDVGYTSTLGRAIETLDLILASPKLRAIQRNSAAALNERDFGDLTGQLKSTLEQRYGAKAFWRIRRSWDIPTPGGESLRQIHARVAPYFRTEILPNLRVGHNTIVVGHSNSLRALVVEIERISPKLVERVEFPTGEVRVYRYDSFGRVVGTEHRLVRAAATD